MARCPSAVIVGEGPLVERCGNVFLARGWRLQAVVSPDPRTRDWAHRSGIRCCSLNELPTTDFLFSIANTRILPEALLQQPRRAAINLHDGPLPRYAGLNVTSWAIAAGEVEHGITWHEMVAKVDAGRILSQVCFPIHPRETSGSLNLECQRVILDSLKDLLEQLESGQIAGRPQDITRRSWFEGRSRPDSVLDLRRDASAIDALVRSHDFTPFPNRFGLTRLWTGTEFHCVGNCALSPVGSGGPPGTVLELRAPANLVICSGDVPLELELSGWDGKPPATEHLQDLVGSRLPNLDSKLREELCRLNETALLQEEEWSALLRDRAPIRLSGPGSDAAGELELTTGLSPAEATERLLQWLTLIRGQGLVGLAVADPVLAPLDQLFCNAIPVALGEARVQAEGLLLRDMLLRYPFLEQLRREMPGFVWPLMIGAGRLARPAPGTVQVVFGKENVKWRWGDNINATSLRAAAQMFKTFLEGSQPSIRPSVPPALDLSTSWRRQALRKPEATALLFGSQRMSYGQLAARVDGLAGVLMGMGIRLEQPVAVKASPGPELVVGWLAILAVGATCVPLDPGLGKERAGYLLERAGANTLLWDGSGEVPRSENVVDLRLQSSETRKLPELHPQLRAFLFFTSGSTGEAKAVSLTQETTGGYQWWPRPLKEGDICCLWSSPAVVDALWQLIAPLLRGLPVVLLTSEVVREPRAFLEALVHYGITRVKMVPSFAASLARVENPPRPPAESVWVLTGESLAGGLAARLRSTFPEVTFLNSYGTTEAAQCDTWYEISGDFDGDSIPAGLPGDHSGVVLGQGDEVQLYGAGMARGYDNDPRATADKFRPCLYLGPGSRLYATGDRGRWTGDGNLVLEGRLDSQVQIRGVRVEPEGVAACLANHPQVQEACVVFKTEPRPQLIAYYTCDSRAGEAGLRSYLAQRFPPEAVPVAWVRLSKLPRLAGGKLDLSRLPSPKTPSKPTPDDCDPQAWELFRRVLKRDDLSADDDFFHCGGDSLLAVSLAQEVERCLGVRLPLASLLSSPRLGDLAAQISRCSPIESALVCLNKGGERPPLVLIHALGGEVFFYRELAAALGQDTPVYGIRLTESARAVKSVAELARLYTDVLLQNWPQGPYLLGGFSLGGLIAHEMACRLRRAGREVKLLVLFDAHGPGYRKLSAGRSQRLLGHFLEALRHLWLGVRLARRMPRERLRFLGRYLLRLRRYYREMLRAKFGSSGVSMRGVGATHDPPSFPGTVTLIRASLQGAGLPDWPCLGWSRVAAKVDTVVVDGFHHITLFESPVVEQIAEALRPRIAE